MFLENSLFSMPRKNSKEIDLIKNNYKKRIQSEIDSYINEDESKDTIEVKDILMIDVITI